jgi:hypothetical protein
MVLDAHAQNDPSIQQFEDLADNLLSTMGPRDALNLTLALLARTTHSSLDDRLDNLSLDREGKN